MNSIKHTPGFDIAQPVEDVFPLFSPEGEELWVPGWEYENVMGTAELFKDYVFLTEDQARRSGWSRTMNRHPG